MLGGYMGRLLRVDLSSGTVKDETLPAEAELRKYLGGIGLAAKILYEEIPPDVRPLDPENRLIFMSGPLGGTPAPSSSDCLVATLSAETGYTLGNGHFHGFFGSAMKFAGYDGIVIQGASTKPVYLVVNDGHAEIRDAAKFWGKDTHETSDLVVEEVGEPEASVACIGPAGEHLVHGASICTDYYHMAAKGGCGTVMGSKKLKAIVVWGTHGVPVADPEALIETRVAWEKAIWAGPGMQIVGNAGVPRGWYTIGGDAGLLAFKNFKDPEGGRDLLGKPISEMGKRSDIRPQGSFSCPIACAYRLVIPDDPHRGYAATLAGGGENIEGAAGLMGVTDPAENLWLTDQCDRLGMDSAVLGEGMAVLFELYESGRLSRADTGGLELKWGNADAVHKLLLQTANKQGLGKFIAAGPLAVAKQFNALDLVIHVKGTAWNIHDWRGRWGTTFSYGVASAGPCHEGIGPDFDFEPDLGYTEQLPGPVAEGKAEGTRLAQVRKLFTDSQGVCWFTIAGVESASDYSARAIAAVTGWTDFSKEEAWQVGERILNLNRCFSIRRGHTPAGDLDFGKRILEPVPSGPAKGKTLAPHLRKMLVDYYTSLGWDPQTGKPKEATLRALGLEQQLQDIANVEIPIKVQDVAIPFEDYVEATGGKQ